MFKGTPELIAQRREEIINACEELYQTMSFREITLKEIGNATSFSRPTIYNYFQTKEEIFLGILTREYAKWNDSMRQLLSENKLSDKDSLAKSIASSLNSRSSLGVNSKNVTLSSFFLFLPLKLTIPLASESLQGSSILEGILSTL